jgi:hypothetical protein
MVKRCGPPSQGWRTFLRNHAPDIAAMDLFVVPTTASICSMSSSSFGWPAETWSGSMPLTNVPIRRKSSCFAPGRDKKGADVNIGDLAT